jgi:hypothetical protein
VERKKVIEKKHRLGKDWWKRNIKKKKDRKEIWKGTKKMERKKEAKDTWR